MNTIPHHLALLSQSMRQSLICLTEVLDQQLPPEPPDMDCPRSEIRDVERRLGEFNRRLHSYVELIADLSQSVSLCSEAGVQGSDAQANMKIGALVASYEFGMDQLQDNNHRLNWQLAAFMRDTLIAIANWNARVIIAIGQSSPSPAYTSHTVPIEVSTRLSHPDTADELREWPVMINRCDRTAMREALAYTSTWGRYPAVGMAGETALSATSRPASSRASQGLGFWGTLGLAFLVGTAFDGLFGDDCDK